jgi:hypothetical protein
MHLNYASSIASRFGIRTRVIKIRYHPMNLARRRGICRRFRRCLQLRTWRKAGRQRSVEADTLYRLISTASKHHHAVGALHAALGSGREQPQRSRDSEDRDDH